MPEDLPIHQDFRRAHRFPGLDGPPKLDLNASLARFDETLWARGGVADPARARSAMTEPGKAGLVRIHHALFHPRDRAGCLRESSLAAVYEGQDCPEPEFLDRSLDNFERWLRADSFGEIHPIEQAALSLTRLVDIWPFDFGNRTSAIVFANFFLIREGYPPFRILPGQEEDFSRALSAAIRMQTELLVGAVYNSILKEVNLEDE